MFFPSPTWGNTTKVCDKYDSIPIVTYFNFYVGKPRDIDINTEKVYKTELNR